MGGRDQQTVQVVPVRRRSALRAFLRLPERLYRHEPAWVPPLLFDLKAQLNPKTHPFHQHAAVEYFLALRPDRWSAASRLLRTTGTSRFTNGGSDFSGSRERR